MSSSSVISWVRVARSHACFCICLWTLVCNFIIFLFGHCIVCPLIYRFWLPLWYLFGHCIVCPLIYRFWLPLWYLQAILVFYSKLIGSDIVRISQIKQQTYNHFNLKYILKKKIFVLNTLGLRISERKKYHKILH
jgi:hypothetical protein